MSCRILFTRSLSPSAFASSKCLWLHTSFHTKLKCAPSSSLVQQRMFSSPSGIAPKHTTPTLEPGFIYLGPLASTFRRLKIFSLSSLVLSSTLAPIMFIVESNLPTTARVALASMIIGTSGLSTGLVGWCAKPYVAKLRRLIPEKNGGAEGIEMITFDILLRPRITRVSSLYRVFPHMLLKINRFTMQPFWSRRNGHLQSGNSQRRWCFLTASPSH
jgi:hypothetical protein